MQPRLSPIDPPFSPAVAEDLRKLMPPGMEPLALFRTLAHNPRVLGRFRRGGLLDPGSISLRERELVILRTTARCGADYEWGVHAAFFGAASGFTDEQLAASAQPRGWTWTPREQLIVDLCDSLHETADVPDDLWTRLRDEFEPAQLVELVVLAGLYRMVSYVVNALRIPCEAGAPRIPTRPSRAT
jgi:alkylhydroperoxidase family enzyme